MRATRVKNRATRRVLARGVAGADGRCVRGAAEGRPLPGGPPPRQRAVVKERRSQGRRLGTRTSGTVAQTPRQDAVRAEPWPVAHAPARPSLAPTDVSLAVAPREQAARTAGARAGSGPRKASARRVAP